MASSVMVLYALTSNDFCFRNILPYIVTGS